MWFLKLWINFIPGYLTGTGAVLEVILINGEIKQWHALLESTNSTQTKHGQMLRGLICSCYLTSYVSWRLFSLNMNSDHEMSLSPNHRIWDCFNCEWCHGIVNLIKTQNINICHAMYFHCLLIICLHLYTLCFKFLHLLLFVNIAKNTYKKHPVNYFPHINCVCAISARLTPCTITYALWRNL